MDKDHENLYALIISQLLYDGYAESAQHLASRALVNLSTVTHCMPSNQLLELYRSQLTEDKSPLIVMIEDETGKTTQLHLPHTVQIENRKSDIQDMEENMETTSHVVMDTEDSSNIATTTVVAVEDSRGSADRIYVNGEAMKLQSEQEVIKINPPDDNIFNMEGTEKQIRRRKQEDEEEIVDGFGEYGPPDPSSEESEVDEVNQIADDETVESYTESQVKSAGENGMSGSGDIWSCSICDSQFTREIILKLHVTAAHPEVVNTIFDKETFKKMRVKKERVREPHQQKIECEYCEKSFTILKFASHIATSGHRRNLAIKKGGKTTLDTLQEQASSSSGVKVVSSQGSAGSEDASAEIMEEGSTETTPVGCIYSSLVMCFRCKSQVAREKFLKEHLKMCPRKIYCEVCCKLFECGRASEHHTERCLPSIPYRCSNCGKGHAKLTALEQHVSQCKTAAKFLCARCFRCFDTFLECKVHESDEVVAYKCATCSEKFTTLAELTEHELEHKENKEEESTGEGTDETPIQKIKTEDDMKPPYMCADCGMGFRHKSSLEVHETKHTDDKPYMCEECGRAYKYQTSLKSHIYTHMKEEAKPHQCRFCGKRFSTSGAVKVHIRKHTGHKPYKCNVCDKTFSQLGPLKSHQRLHSGEKPFVCKFCNYDFSSHGSLSAHLKSRHKSKPFYCTYCQKGFNTESALTRHLESHGINSETVVAALLME